MKTEAGTSVALASFNMNVINLRVKSKSFTLNEDQSFFHFKLITSMILRELITYLRSNHDSTFVSYETQCTDQQLS